MKAVQWAQAAIFLSLGLAALLKWARLRERRQAHLALATGLFGVGQLVSAVSQTLWDTSKGEMAPRAVSITSGTITFLAMYAFLLFLGDFLPFPGWARGLAIVVTVVNIVLAAIERADIAIVGGKLVKLVVHNPIPYMWYLQYVIVYLLAVFGLLSGAFVIYGARLRGIARVRMLSIGSGFFLLFVAIGLIPRVLFGKPSSETIEDVVLAVRILALASGPLLFLGFAPPSALVRRFAQAVASGDNER
ncbi:MAG: hypothetical protein HY775_00150 [Acidobacteria bacterium]|nr:hypothetical protein [Acidobacteriota bacterium]